RRGDAPCRPARLQRAISPGGVARAARRVVPVRTVHDDNRVRPLVLAQVLDQIIAFAARDQAKLLEAREEWETAAGRVFDDDPLYEERTVAFLEWYALERRGADGRVEAQRFVAQLNDDPTARAWALALAASHRSLFQVRQRREGEMRLDDLLGGAEF